MSKLQLTQEKRTLLNKQEVLTRCIFIIDRNMLSQRQCGNYFHKKEANSVFCHEPSHNAVNIQQPLMEIIDIEPELILSKNVKMEGQTELDIAKETNGPIIDLVDINITPNSDMADPIGQLINKEVLILTRRAMEKEERDKKRLEDEEALGVFVGRTMSAALEVALIVTVLTPVIFVLQSAILHTPFAMTFWTPFVFLGGITGLGLGAVMLAATCFYLDRGVLAIGRGFRGIWRKIRGH